MAAALNRFDFEEDEEVVLTGPSSALDPNRGEDDQEEHFDDDAGSGSESEGEEEDDDVSSTSTSEQIVVEDKKKCPWACRYCGVSTPSCVARCMESGWWFCNGTGGSTASHLIQHMVRARHKEVCLHPESPLQETIVECYNCGSRNCFNMGFLPKGDGVVILLCRNCLGLGALKELGWEHDAWMPLVKDRSFVPWLISVPTEDEQLRARKVTAAQIDKLEQLWKTDPSATIEDLDKASGIEDELAPVQLHYEDGFHFQNVFGPLVQIEADYDRDMKEALTEDNVSVMWHSAPKSTISIPGTSAPTPASNPAFAGDGKWVSADVNFSVYASESLRLTVGDELLLRVSRRLLNSTAYKNDWEAKATVVKVGEPGEPTLVEVLSSTKPPVDVREGYSVSFVWKPITFDRMQLAMKRFATEPTAVSNFIYRKILGHDADELQAAYQLGGGVLSDRNAYLSAPGLPELNPSQQSAVQQVLSRPLALIQGPPGTGKTVTLATLVYHMVAKEHRRTSTAVAGGKGGGGKANSASASSSKGAASTANQKSSSTSGNKGKSSNNNSNEFAHSPVLVCAPSNVAVDHLAERIHQTGVKVLRLSAKSREHIDSKVEHLTLHNMISVLEEGENPSSSSEPKKGGKKGRRGNEDSKRRKQLERELIREADVVCCTCSGAGDPRLVGMRFRRVLIDEATQATEPESLIPIVMGCEQFILVGDHCQLGPVVMSKRAATAGLNSSLFERLVTLGLRPVRLQIQYRMHPCLSEWPSNTFYEGSLQNGVTAQDRTNDFIDFPWIDPDRPMMFYSCLGTEEIAATGTSFLNRAEAQACEKIVTTLVRGGVAPSQVGIITPYEGQRAFIVQQLHHFGPLKSTEYAEVEVSSVDAFQGREKEYIVVSCVRSNEKQGIGFLNDPRRLNVALTRAKRGLIVLGNPRVLAKRPLWNDLLCHFRERGLLVEGPLNNLQPSLMRFPKVKKYYRDPRQRLFEERAAQVFSGDLSNPYGDALLQTPAGFGFGDFDYANASVGGPATQLTQQSQQSQSTTGGFFYHRNGGPSLDFSRMLTEGPATQLTQSQRTQASQS